MHIIYSLVYLFLILKFCYCILSVYVIYKVHGQFPNKTMYIFFYLYYTVYERKQEQTMYICKAIKNISNTNA